MNKDERRIFIQRLDRLLKKMKTTMTNCGIITENYEVLFKRNLTFMFLMKKEL